MNSLISKILLDTNEKEMQKKVFYLKSLVCLILIIIIISNFIWDMTDSIKVLLSEQVLTFAVNIIEIGLHFFTIFGVIALLILCMAAIANWIVEKLAKKTKRFEEINNTNYFYEMHIGATLHFERCVENVLLLLMLAFVFDYSLIEQYKNIYCDMFWWEFYVIFFVFFAFLFIKRIFNRMFVFWWRDDVLE